VSASSDTLQKQTCTLGSHGWEQPSLVLQKISVPHLHRAAAAAAGPGVNHLDGVEGTKAMWLLWEPFNGESLKETPPTP